ncbi:MAG: hypothetical protein GKR95_25300 [Gammaproteobacteria bacterium]|nr:hypothetical protein [Gammaproteobacteria bacterium]NKB65274.1 hypothetical protein [Gammaproteobacteria bacterium]
MRPIHFVDKSRSTYVQNGLNRICEILNGRGVTAGWCDKVVDAPEGAILVVHDPVEIDQIPLGCSVLGQRTLNRRERLILAEQSDLPVPAWGSLDDSDRFSDLLDEWDLDVLLHKADWSYARKGVQARCRGDTIDRNSFDPNTDVFMQMIQGGSYHTYKVDMYFDQIIGCRYVYTYHPQHEMFHKKFSQYSKQRELPGLSQQLETLGRAVMAHGVGLSGVDIMVDVNDRSWVIELNTSSVGRESTWQRWPDIYINNYAQGILKWLNEGSDATFCTDRSPLVHLLTARSGGIDVRT